MSWILWRYVSVELLKVMVLTTAVLVVVIAFGATIKPLIQNKLDPVDVGKYALLASVPMLQFALPFAAGFAATLVLHRMAGDNEILAMSVSGMSYRKVFAPVFWLGLALTVLMFLLVNFAVPHFWGMLQEMIARDVTRIFTTTVEKGEALSLGRTQLFADDVLLAEEPTETGADERLILLGVAALETDDNGEPRSEFTARYATVDIHHRRRDALLKLALVDATIYRHDDGSLIFVPKAVPEALSLSKDFSSGPKTRNSVQLMALLDDLSGYPSIVSRRENLLGALDEMDAYACVARGLARDGTIDLVSSLGIERIRISDARLVGDRLVGNPLSIVQYEDEEPIRRAEVEQAELVVLSATGEEPPRLELRVSTSDAYDLRGRGDLRTRWPPRLTGLTVDACPPEPWRSLDDLQLIERARALGPTMDGPSERLLGKVTTQVRRLDDELNAIGNDIRARFVHRSAQTLTTFLLLMLGSVLAVLMRGGLPLGIYALAFVPAVVDILMISGGEQMIKYGDLIPGTIVAWSGNGILVLLVASSWWRLARN